MSPRVVFDREADFEEWLRFSAQPGRYIAYGTNLGEFIIKPVRSVRDWDFGYFKTQNETIGKIHKLLKEFNIPLFGCKRYEWRVDQAVGVKVPTEDD